MITWHYGSRVCLSVAWRSRFWVDFEYHVKADRPYLGPLSDGLFDMADKAGSRRDSQKVGLVLKTTVV